MRWKIVYFVVFVFFVSCVNRPNASFLAPVQKEAVVEDVGDIMELPGHQRNAAIRLAVSSKKFRRAETFIFLASDARARKWPVPSSNPAATYRALSEGFTILPATELTADNIDRYLVELPTKYKHRAAVLLVDSGRLDAEARERAFFYYERPPVP